MICGVGLDLCDTARIAQSIDKHGKHFLDRCFTAQEQAYCDESQPQRHQRYAARFAAKEAVLKALGTGIADGTSWLDIAITRDNMGKPSVQLSGTSQQIADKRGIQSWQISLTHLKDVTAAMAIAVSS